MHGMALQEVRRDDGAVFHTCLNPHSEEDHAWQQQIGFCFAASVSVVVLLSFLIAAWWVFRVGLMFTSLEAQDSTEDSREQRRETPSQSLLLEAHSSSAGTALAAAI